MTLLFGAALAVRLPYLMLIPRLEDEGVEVLWGLDIANGKSLPLTGSDPYYGPLFAYLVALLFRLLGPSLVWPRLMVAILGALTVPATYWLGRATCGRRAGLIASLLALVSRSLITVSSHYGWSNSLCPFFATVTLAACVEGYSRRSAALLVSGGLFAGLTVQTHPITATIVVGIAIWLLMPSSILSAFRPSVLCLAAAAFLIAYSPVLWATAHNDLSVLGIGATRAYAFVPITSTSEYVQRLIRLCHGLWRAALAGFPPYAVGGFSSHSRQLASQALGLAFLACASGALIAGGRRRSLIALVLLSSLFLLPLVIRNYFVRYLTYLLPLVYVLIGDLLAQLSFRLIPLNARWPGAPRTRRLRLATGVLVLAGIAATPLLTLGPYYERSGKGINDADPNVPRAGSNRPFFELRQALRANGACRDAVFLENVLPENMESTAGTTRRDYTWAYFNHHSIRYVLTLDSCPFQVGSAEQLLGWSESRGVDAWFVLSGRSVDRFAERFTIRKVLDVLPTPPVPADLQLALYSAHPKRD